MKHSGAAVGLAWAILLAGCGAPEIVPEPYHPTNAHQAYLQSLVDAGLAHTALAQEWIDASRESLDSALQVDLPYRESLYVDAAEAFAAGYRFRSRRGRRVEVRVDCQAPEPFRLFVDLFRLEEDAGREHVASATVLERRLAFEPRGEFDYLLRVQPELLRGGRIEVTIGDEPALSFPVDGHDTGSIRSRFGDPRDGGRRRHHGVDIFAARHTPVVAASRGRVTRVDESRLGGRVVWMRDLERPIFHYYAHLETQAVQAGQQVEAGAVLGTVGNSGNARSTRPHLHFGLYARGVGPLDPWDYLLDEGRRPAEPAVGLELLGRWARVNGETAFRTTPEHDEAARLPPSTAIRVLGAVGNLFRVGLPDGSFGFVPAERVQSAEVPLREAETRPGIAVLDRPSTRGLEISRTAADGRVPVWAKFEDYWMVSAEDGRRGWARLEGGPVSE